MVATLVFKSSENHSLVMHYLHSNRDNQSWLFKNNIGLKTPLQLGISEPVFYGDLVNKIKRSIKKRYKCYKNVGYNLGMHAWL